MLHMLTLATQWWMSALEGHCSWASALDYACRNEKTIYIGYEVARPDGCPSLLHAVSVYLSSELEYHEALQSPSLDDKEKDRLRGLLDFRVTNDEPIYYDVEAAMLGTCVDWQSLRQQVDDAMKQLNQTVLIPHAIQRSREEAEAREQGGGALMALRPHLDRKAREDHQLRKDALQKLFKDPPTQPHSAFLAIDPISRRIVDILARHGDAAHSIFKDHVTATSGDDTNSIGRDARSTLKLLKGFWTFLGTGRSGQPNTLYGELPSARGQHDITVTAFASYEAARAHQQENGVSPPKPGQYDLTSAQIIQIGEEIVAGFGATYHVDRGGYGV